jgi:hypothetical protein
MTFKDVNVEELENKPDLSLPKDAGF